MKLTLPALSFLLSIGLAACGADRGEDAAAAQNARSLEGVSSVTQALEEGNNDLGAISKVKIGDTLATSDMVLGDKSAPMVIVEYASLTCPHCATLHENVFPMIIEEFVNTGKAQYIYRDFPTAPAQLSYAGSAFARCMADEKGPEAYFAIINTLFKTQKTWVYGETPQADLVKIAGQTGVDEAGFLACIGRADIIEAINAIVQEAVDDYQIRSTPTLFVNGKEMTRAADAEGYRVQLDEAHQALLATK